MLVGGYWRVWEGVGMGVMGVGVESVEYYVEAGALLGVDGSKKRMVCYE